MSKSGRRHQNHQDQQTAIAEFEGWQERMARFAPPEAMDRTLDAVTKCQDALTKTETFEPTL